MRALLYGVTFCYSLFACRQGCPESGRPYFCVQSRLGIPSDTLNDSFTVQRSGTATFETIGECLKRTPLNQYPEPVGWLLLKLSFRRFCVLRVSPKRRALFRRDLRRYLDHVWLLSRQVPILGFCTASRFATPSICRGRRGYIRECHLLGNQAGCTAFQGNRQTKQQCRCGNPARSFVRKSFPDGFGMRNIPCFSALPLYQVYI